MHSKVSTDLTSISSSEGRVDNTSESNTKLELSAKSQADSGIGGEEGFNTSENSTHKQDGFTSQTSSPNNLLQQNNTLTSRKSSTNQKVLNIGQHVNDLHHKDTNIKKINVVGSQNEEDRSYTNSNDLTDGVMANGQ